jgi:O-antigen/teichoic acid export membrane protein
LLRDSKTAISMSDLKTLYRHSSHYLGGRVAVMLLGFASFPVFTRVFSVADYGTINLITNIVLLLTVLSKFGLQHAVQRYYPESANSADADALPRYYATLFYGTALIGLALTLGFAATFPFGSARFFGITAGSALLLACILVMVRSLRSMQTNLLQMENKTRLFNVADIAQKAGVIAVTCLLLFFWRKSIFSFFLGAVAVETAVFLQYLPFLVKRRLVSPQMFNAELLRSAVAFSFPLMAAEISWVALSSGDRFFVQHYLGAQALGYYAAAYGIATYLQDVLMSPLQLALFPLCMKVWATKGARETQELLSRGLDQFAIVAVAIVAIVISTARDVTVALASRKFQEAHRLLPFLVVGLVLSATTIYFRPGLLIHKQASKIAMATLYASVLNIGMNIVLLPRIGMTGAAIATMISYAIMVVFLGHASLKVLPFKLEARAFIGYAVAGIVAAWTSSRLSAPNLLLSIVLKGGAALTMYCAIVWAIDARVRESTAKALSALRSWRAGPATTATAMPTIAQEEIAVDR